MNFAFTASMCLGLFKSSIIKNLKFNPMIHSFEDWEYIMRVLTRSSEIGILHMPCYHYYEVMGSASKSPLDNRKTSALLITDSVTKEFSGLESSQLEAQVGTHLLIKLMCIASTMGCTDKKIYDLIKTTGRKYCIRSLKNPYIMKRFKIYILLISISPYLFKMAYKTKNGRINER